MAAQRAGSRDSRSAGADKPSPTAPAAPAVAQLSLWEPAVPAGSSEGSTAKGNWSRASSVVPQKTRMPELEIKMLFAD